MPGEKQSFDPIIRIGNRFWATEGLHIASYCDITIGDDVMVAGNVFISDGTHGYEDATIPYMYQPRTRIHPIRIKSGCWIGQNVVVMPGVSIGENVVIGANSVVTRDIPDRCIAVGSPARVIRTWDDEARCWISANGEKL